MLPGILGLSPTANGGQTLRGESICEFIHAVTGEDMLLVYFTNVIGERALLKKACLLEGVDGAGPSRQFEEDPCCRVVRPSTRFTDTPQ